MFGVSITELLLILFITLLVFGPDKLPDLAKTLGKITGTLKKSTDALRREFYNSVYSPAEDFKHRLDEEARSLVALEDEVPKKDPLCPDTIAESIDETRETQESTGNRQDMPQKEDA